MIALQNFLNVFTTLSLLSSPESATGEAPWFSLWGEAADFTLGCKYWSLKPQITIPALQELTVCFNLNLKGMGSSPWTAFMYRHPMAQYAELGLGRKAGHLVVWLFGVEWRTQKIDLLPSKWYSLCVTWSCMKGRPALYLNNILLSITAVDGGGTFTSPRCSELAPNGSLTLGSGHFLVNGDIRPFSGVPGKLTLFRIWGRERSSNEVTSLSCTEGDVVKWERNNWDTQICAPHPEPSLTCDWSIYKLELMITIVCLDGSNTESYTARDIAHHWLRKELPRDFHLHMLSMFEVSRSSAESLVKASYEDQLIQWTSSNISRFHCLVYLNVIPAIDVAAVQNLIDMKLKNPYNDPSGLLQLLCDTNSIHTTPVDSFLADTSSPDMVTQPSLVTDFIFTTTTSPPTSFSTTTFRPPTTSINTSIPTTATMATAATAAATAATTTATIATTTTIATTATTTAMTATTATTTATTATTTTHSENVTELYFEVKVNVSITGDTDPEQILCTWLNDSLPANLMIVLEFQLLPKAQRYHPKLQSDPPTSVFAYRTASCVFQVQVRMQSDIQDMEEKIRHLLLRPYNNGSISIHLEEEDIEISRILLIKCSAETHHTLKGLFEWTEVSGGKTAVQTCPKNPDHHATRHCKLSLSTHWMAPELEDCAPVVETIPDLQHVEVTSGNALDVVEMIEALLKSHSTLNYQDLATVLDKLEGIISTSVVTPDLGQALLNIISDILKSDSDLVPFTNDILNITEAVGDRMVGYEGSSTLVAPAVAITVVDVPGQFDSLTFGVASNRTGKKPEIFINRYPFNSTLAFISLPSVLQQCFPSQGLNQTPPRVQFQFYAIPWLFKGSQKGQTLNTFVVSASVTNASCPIKDLAEDIEVTLHHLIPNTLYKKVECVYWNFSKNNGQGDWDDYGCRQNNSNSKYTTCLCDHLTHFGVLLDVSRTQLDPANEHILTIITYLGCGVSSLFLGITVLTYTAFEKLRRDYPSQILINLSLALLGLNLVFLVNSWLSSLGVYPLCVAVASTLHYFLLASFTWMGLEAVNMYFALVKVFNAYVPAYILKFCVLGWGFPLIICILVLIVNREAYGSHLYTDTRSTFELLDNSDNFCWIQNDVTFYVSVVAYAVLIFLFNTGVFVVVLIQIRRMRANSPAGTSTGVMQDLKGVASLTLLLGLTWTIGFFSWGPARIVLLYLFSGFNSLQGLFIFFFHCLMKENVRKQWRIHLCFGRFRLEEHSEWSNSASIGVLAKPKTNPPGAPRPSGGSTKSSSTESTSASSNYSQRDSSCKRPNLGLFMNSLTLPQAHRSPSGTGGLPSYRGVSPTPGWRNHLLHQQEQRREQHINHH